MKHFAFIYFAIFWAGIMWIVTASTISFIRWDNYFVMGLQEWHPFARFMFVIFWTGGMICFTSCLLYNNKESK